MTSFQVEVFQDPGQKELAKQQFEGVDYLLGSSSIFMIRSFDLSQKVVIFGTDPLDMYNFTTLKQRIEVTSFYSGNSESARSGVSELSLPAPKNFCPISVAFSSSFSSDFEILSSCSDNIVLVTYRYSLESSESFLTIQNVYPITFYGTASRKKFMCKGQSVNSLWVQDNGFVLSIDPINGDLIVYPLLSDSSPQNSSVYKIAKMICVSESNYIITLVYQSD